MPFQGRCLFEQAHDQLIKGVTGGKSTSQEPLPPQNAWRLSALPILQLQKFSLFFDTRIGPQIPSSLSQALFPRKGHPKSGGTSVTVCPPSGSHMCQTYGFISGFRKYKKRVQTLTPLRFFLSYQPKTVQGKSDFQNALNHLVSQGLVVTVPPQDRIKGFYSNLFMVLKPNCGICPIQYLKSPQIFVLTHKVGNCLSETKGLHDICRPP